MLLVGAHLLWPQTFAAGTGADEKKKAKSRAEILRELSLGHIPCNIDRVHYPFFTLRDFEQYYRGIYPVIIVDMDQSRWAKISRAWHDIHSTAQWLDQQHLNGEIQADDPATIALFGNAYPLNAASTSESLLRNIYSDKKNYSFNNFFPDDPVGRALRRDAPAFSYFDYFGEKTREQFAFGASGTGLPWHSHDDAWNRVVRGAKLWMIRDRRNQAGFCHSRFEKDWENSWVDTDSSSLRWAAEAVGNLQTIFTCIVEKNEAIYVPRRYMHATVNLGEVASRSQLRQRFQLKLPPVDSDAESSFQNVFESEGSDNASPWEEHCANAP